MNKYTSSGTNVFLTSQSNNDNSIGKDRVLLISHLHLNSPLYIQAYLQNSNLLRGFHKTKMNVFGFKAEIAIVILKRTPDYGWKNSCNVLDFTK
jgi:hypothetical protein